MKTILLCLLFFTITINAENLVTIDGRTFTNAVLTTNHGSIAVISHSGGLSGVQFTNLPESFRSRFGLELPINSSSAVVQPDTANPTDAFLSKNQDNPLQAVFYVDEKSVEKTANEDTARDKYTWSIAVQGADITIHKFKYGDYKNGPLAEMKCKIWDEPALSQLLNKYLEWDSIAETNKAEPFTKIIGTLGGTRIFKFQWESGDSTLWDEAFLHPAYYLKSDVQYIVELLKQVPDLKQKLVDKIRNQAAQKNLFK